VARKFLYVFAVLILLVIAALFALRIWGDKLTELALVPSSPFEQQQPLSRNAYANPAMWYSRPDMAAAQDPARWRPEGAQALPAAHAPPYAVFFIHPTSYLQRDHWNAPADDAQAQVQARIFLRGMASAFGEGAQVWAPKYRQATFGAMITDKPEARLAVDLAYADIAMAFDQFVASIPADRPIVLAGHSQGSLHLLRLLKEKIAGTPLQARIAMAYPVGWPISPAHDIPALGLPACTTAAQGGCIASWASFAEPAEPGMFMDIYRRTPGLDGQAKGDDPILCLNPLTGTRGGAAPASANLGTLVPDADLKDGKLVPASVPAHCGADGLLLVGDPPKLGPFVLPGNNYHVYDYPLFWANMQQDVARRVGNWAAAR
jgi:hypothetical protein